MDNKGLTPMQIARRKYEEKNKEARKAATAQFSTFIPRDFYNELNEYLEKHKITKVSLIYAGYEAIKQDLERQRKEIENK